MSKTSGMPPKFERTSVRIDSAKPGWQLDAWKYVPSDTQNSTRHPVIVMAHGFAADKLHGLDLFAERYAAEGYACIVFDYRRWGSSDGTLRHTVRVAEQLDDYRTVVNWVRKMPEFDEKRIVLWGTSFSGGHVIRLASEDPDIAAALCQCPYAGSEPKPPPAGTEISRPSTLGLLRVLYFAVIDLVKQALGFAPYYVPSVAEPGGKGISTAPGALSGYQSNLSGSVPQVNASSIFEVTKYNPRKDASSITCPLLFVLPEADNICSIPAALEAVNAAKRGEVIRVEGGHFDVYPSHSGHEKAVEAQINFLHRHVPVE